MEFKTVRKGYDKKEVDAYIEKMDAEKQASEVALRATLAQLKGELDEKQQKLDDFEKKAKRISDALISAVSKADEIEKLAVYKYNQEMDQLKSFHARWVAYYARLMKKYPLSEELDAVKEFNDKVGRILGEGAESDDSARRFREEFNRLIKQNGVLDDDGTEDIPSVAPATFIKVEEERPAPAPDLKNTVSESGFSFEEALNPKESLEEIMADLGFLMDEQENK